MRITGTGKMGVLVALAVMLSFGAFTVFVGADTASAANVHLKKPGVSATDNGLTLTVSGALAGLGNGDVLVTLSATADVSANCTNPAGQSKVPGQNPAPITVTGSVAIPDPQSKNGTTPFTVATTAPQTPIAGAPDCPNSGWSENITDLAFTSFSLVVEQPVGTTVLEVQCTFSSPTSDGSVPKNSIIC